MSSRVTINKEVAVTAVYFNNSRELTSYPKRIEFEGREYTFRDGLRYLVQKGQRLIQIFDMTDGQAEYRLRFDNNEQLWTLIDISEAPRALA
ncbi:MAG TPA: hypothetical protein VLA92_01600 [Candidatus Saccharimonadales bacterium]|nr:hypothetical protein [Candidatus Saccharimonadales bacterium]